MPNYVLDCRIFFSDLPNAENAFNHIKALAEHSAAHSVHVGNDIEGSWARLHDCKADENNGDTSLCADIQLFTLAVPEQPGGEVIAWTAGETVSIGDVRSYEGTNYSCLQGHTTQAGWEPPNVPALWQVV